MKRIVLLPLLVVFLAACASSPKLIDDQIHDCGPGQDLEIRAGLEGIRNRQIIEPGEELAFLVEVANNSHHDVVIRTIRIDPKASGRTSSTLDSSYRSVEQEILSGKDHLFRLPTRLRVTPTAEREMRRNDLSTTSEMTVTLTLQDGDVYRCSFALAF